GNGGNACHPHPFRRFATARLLALDTGFLSSRGQPAKEGGTDDSRPRSPASTGHPKSGCDVARSQGASARAFERGGAVTTTDVTYGQLDKVLRSLGFSSDVVQGKPPARHYEHKETGAFISVPPLPASDHVLEHHLVT